MLFRSALNRFTWQTSTGEASPPMVSKVVGVRLSKGQRLRLETPGGGGFGEPAERDPRLVTQDIRRGLISASAAQRDYAAGRRSHGGPQ